MSEKKQLELKVAEALQNDVGRGIVRIDEYSMRALDISSGDIVEIEGEKVTAAIVWPSHIQDSRLGIIRMDGSLRQNSGTSLGDRVFVRKAEVGGAKKVIMAPTRHEIKFGGDFGTHLRQRLLGRPIVVGDTISIGVLGEAIPFMVIKTEPKGVIQVRDFTEFEVKEKPTSVTETPAIRYEDIGGLKDEIARVREMVELPMKHPELFEKLGIKPPKGVLLYGPPGTGKTLLARAVASESNAYFIPLNGPEIMDKYYGESERKLRDIFKEGEENAPSIIFIDEIDSIAPKREEVRGEVERRVVAQLLASMDGLVGRGNVIVIGATNREDSIDPALRRPGRFDREIEIGVPDRGGRKEIMQIHTRGMPLYHWDNLVALAELKSEVGKFFKDPEKIVRKKREQIEHLTNEAHRHETALQERKKEFEKLEGDIKAQTERIKGEIDVLVRDVEALKKEKGAKGGGSVYYKIVELIENKNAEIKDGEEDISALKKELAEQEDKLSKESLALTAEITSEKRKIDEINKSIVKVERDKKDVLNLKDDPDRYDRSINETIKKLEELNHQDTLLKLGDIRKFFIAATIKQANDTATQLIQEFLDLEIISDEFIKNVIEKSILKLIEDIANVTHGFVGADLEALTREAAMHTLTENVEGWKTNSLTTDSTKETATNTPKKSSLPKIDLEKDEIPVDILERLRVKKDDFMHAKKSVSPSALREVLVEVPDVKWTDIGGLKNVKQELREAVEWPLKNPEVFKRMGIRPSKAVLLYGPSGCGKTLLAKAAATESEANLIAVKGPELLSMWVGESERGVREIFKKAKQTAPTIILFDEIDALASKRRSDASSGSHATETVVNQILTEMDGIEALENVMIVGTTNRPDMLDPSLLRPGRFDSKVLVTAPDRDARLAIFEIHTKGMPLKGVDLAPLADKTKGYSGADIEAVCREAALIALRESKDLTADKVTDEHFKQALKKIKPSVSKEILDKYEEMAAAKKELLPAYS